MSKPRYRWWGYVRAVIRAYPELKERVMEVQQTHITPRYGCVGGSGGVSDPVSASVLRTLAPQEQREYEAVREAIRETNLLPDGPVRLSIIEFVFWRKSHTLQGAAQKVHLGYRAARERQQAFICLVGHKLGLT